MAISMNDASLKAVDTASNTVTSVVANPPSAPELNLFANVGTSFVLVIGLILALAWLVKRSGLKKYTSGLINIKANYSVTAKERIILVEVDNKLLVVGVTPQQMTLLHTVDEENTKTLLSEENNNKAAPLNSAFHQLLQSSLKRNK